MSDLVTVQKTSAGAPRKVYQEYQERVKRLKTEFSQTDNGARKNAINEEVEALHRQYGSAISRNAQAIWEKELSDFDKADKQYSESERKAKRVLSALAREHLDVAKAEVRAAQDIDEVAEVYENAKGDTAFRYAVALEAQGRLGELMNDAMEPTDRAEISRHINELSRDAESLHYTDELLKEQAAVIKQAQELENLQTDYTEINQSFQETGLNFSLNRLQIENEVLPDGRMRHAYFVAPPRNYTAAIRRGLEGGKKYTQWQN